jgi:uncharacterized protein (TIGR00299 family) protein
MIAYFDCFSGICGDMILGALVDAGVSPSELKKQLLCLPIKGYRLEVKAVKRAGLAATKVNVVLRQGKGGKGKGFEGRKFKDIENIVKKSSLPNDIKRKGLSIFKRLFKAEAKVHGESIEKVHLHELGAVDCIIDIFGALIGLELLGVKKIYSSPVNIGSGSVKARHGILPVPSPAAAQLLKDVPVYSSGARFELATPTGAALLSGLVEEFCPMPELRISKIGMGAGNKNFKEQPNVLRFFIGQKADYRTQNPPSPPFSKGGKGGINDWVTEIETNIDDMNPQIYEHVLERLFKAGAIDVFLTQVIMKKGRPGIKLSLLCTRDKKDLLSGIILTETTSIGLRFHEVRRKTLERSIKPVKTRYGSIKVKISRSGRGRVKVTPEYEDCKKIARKFNIPLLDVLKEVMEKS